MTVVPLPLRLFTVAEYAALPEDTDVRYELQEGRLVMSPSPRPDHQHCLVELIVALRPQLPDGFELIAELDIDLALAPPARPGFVRAPDLVVVRAAARERTRADGGLIRAEEVVLAIEITSPGSRRTDRVIKLGEYADAGIPHYWIVDADDEPAVQAFVRDEGGYREAEPVTGLLQVAAPFPIVLDLSRLR